jgi:hypothetical protein
LGLQTIWQPCGRAKDLSMKKPLTRKHGLNDSDWDSGHQLDQEEDADAGRENESENFLLWSIL